MKNKIKKNRFTLNCTGTVAAAITLPGPPADSMGPFFFHSFCIACATTDSLLLVPRPFKTVGMNATEQRKRSSIVVMRIANIVLGSVGTSTKMEPNWKKLSQRGKKTTYNSTPRAAKFPVDKIQNT